MKRKAILLFLDELDKLCKKHNISISHEDGHGAFLFVKYEPFYMEWMHDSVDSFFPDPNKKEEIKPPKKEIDEHMKAAMSQGPSKDEIRERYKKLKGEV